MNGFRIERRSKPWQRSCNGFRTDGLPARLREILARNQEMAGWSEDDVACAFVIRNAEVKRKVHFKTVYHSFDGENFELVGLERPEELVRWRCAYCTKSILARIGDPSASSLACRRCQDRVKANDGPLIESSVDFIDACKRSMLKRKRYILRYIKKNRRNE